ncbi:MAG: NYN domain protein [Parcubacteria group bacterium ADurb.Bin192]|nr:MAG: NYN domain protein [Parcubacteria group bacterium ADurb.Bin192]
MIKRPAQRVAVLIDTQNMYHSAKHLYDAKLNFPGIVRAATEDRQLVRATAYVAKSKTGEELSFFEALVGGGIELRVKEVLEFSSGVKKADWDVGMAIDAVKLADKVDAMILITGDGDFVPCVEYLQAKGVVVEVIAFGASTSSELKGACDLFIDISEEADQFLIRSSGRHKPHGQKQMDKDVIGSVINNDRKRPPKRK